MRQWLLLAALLFIRINELNAQTSHSKNHSPASGILAKDWQAIIDSTWGVGLPTGEKLAIFDTVWTVIDERFACFQNLEVDWLALRDLYRPEIESGVSRGRFAAIMNHLALALRESHTIFVDTLVNYHTEPAPGVPLVFAGGWGDNGHFGAGLTPLPDSSLLVYDAVSPHPLGLVPGDVVLGYDGIPWKRLYRQLLSAEFPISNFYRGIFRWGSNETAFTHSWLMSAGMNWHLFDTIDIVKYATADTLHLSTRALVGQEMSLYCSEQLPVPGVPRPDVIRKKYVTWGIVEGTHIGYVYVRSWQSENSGPDFFNAIDSLTRVQKTDGIILDFRSNPGGYAHASWSGLGLLFDSNGPAMGMAWRGDPDNHLQMEAVDLNFSFVDYSPRFYDKPIAVLTGPGAFSATDFNSFWMKAHPKARLFGKTTASAFSAAWELVLSAGVWYVEFAYLNGFVGTSADRFLTHVELEIDEPVWLTAEDAYQGRDTVVEAAIQWIEETTVRVEEQIADLPIAFQLSQNYPNPFNPSTTITYSLSEATTATLEILNMLGQRVKILVNEKQKEGVHSARWEGTDDSGQWASSGVYVYQLRAGDRILSRKMLLMK